MVETIGKRIKEQRKSLKLTQLDVARKMNGVSHAAISQWENDITKPNAENLLDLSIILQCDFSWLLRGNPKKNNEISSIPFFLLNENRLPIYPWKFLDRLKASNITQPIDSTVEYIMTDSKISKNAFGLKINDDSNSPEFQIGDIVIIDPDVEPEAGEFVVVKYGENFIFRKFKLDINASPTARNFVLIPLNDDYSILYSASVKLDIIGTMVEHRIYRRKR